MTRTFKGDAALHAQQLFGTASLDEYARPLGPPSADQEEQAVRGEIARDFKVQPELEQTAAGWRIVLVLGRGPTQLAAWTMAYGAITAKRLRERTGSW